jgi:hypothetical protein
LVSKTSKRKKSNPGIACVGESYVVDSENTVDLWDFVNREEYLGECAEECYSGKYGVVSGDVTLLLQMEEELVWELEHCSYKQILIAEKSEGSSSCWFRLEKDGADASGLQGKAYGAVCHFIKTPPCIRSQYDQIIERRRRRKFIIKNSEPVTMKPSTTEKLKLFAKFYKQFKEEKSPKGWCAFVGEKFEEYDDSEVVPIPTLYRWRKMAAEAGFIKKDW